jgi:hypothetical protein
MSRVKWKVRLPTLANFNIELDIRIRTELFRIMREVALPKAQEVARNANIAEAIFIIPPRRMGRRYMAGLGVPYPYSLVNRGTGVYAGSDPIHIEPIQARRGKYKRDYLVFMGLGGTEVYPSSVTVDGQKPRHFLQAGLRAGQEAWVAWCHSNLCKGLL